MAPMLEMIKIIKNSKMLIGTISKNLPKAGINIEVVITINELRTAKIKYLFLKMPTLNAG